MSRLRALLRTLGGKVTVAWPAKEAAATVTVPAGPAYWLIMDRAEEQAGELTLGLATLADVDLLLPMMVEFNAGEQIVVEAPAIRPALIHLLEDGRLGRVWLFLSGGAVVGYGVVTFGYDLEFAGRDAFVTEIYLRPDGRGRGLGRQALAGLEAAASGEGARAMHLMVRPENEPAVRLYASAGYVSPPRVFLSKILARR